MANYTILTSMVKDFSKKINHIANKCYKMGIPYTFIVSDPYDRVVETRDSHFVLSVTDIELDIQFKFNGWTSLGLIQRKDGIVQCYLKTQDLIQQYGNTDFHCDHCHKRVHRNSVIVLEHDSGIRKVVGTSCVKEFTCGLDGDLIASYIEFEKVWAKINNDMETIFQGEDLDDIPVSVFCEQNGHPIYNIESVVSCAVRLINAYGFEPSGSINATWKFIHDAYKANREVELEATKAIEWIKSLSYDEFTKSSYLFNLKQIIDAGYCSSRHFGLLTSLIPSYRKAEAKRIQESNIIPSNHVGTAGDKLSLTLTYTKSVSYDSMYGTGYFHFFKDSDGNVFKWSTNKPLEYSICLPNTDSKQIFRLDQGATVKLSGTVKDHDEYRGVKQTILTRCKYEVTTSAERDERIAEMNENISESQTRPNSVDEVMDSVMAGWV